MESKKQFNRRAFVALMSAISGLGLPITGLMNHIYGMEFLTVRRHVWMSAHNSLAIIFTITATWHVILNRQALLRHIKAAKSGIMGVSREMAYASAIIAVVLLIMVGHALHLR